MSEDSCNKLIVRMGIIIQNLVIFLIFFSYKLTAKTLNLVTCLYHQNQKPALQNSKLNVLSLFSLIWLLQNNYEQQILALFSISKA